jgi:hypothetical protein
LKGRGIMKKAVYLVSLAIVLAIVGTLIYDYFTISKSEAIQISERYIAAQSFKWKFREISSDKDAWVVALTPVELVPEAAWLYIDKRTGKIIKFMETE